MQQIRFDLDDSPACSSGERSNAAGR